MQHGWLVLMALLGGAIAHADVVVLRDGKERSGTVERCDEEVCRLNGSPIPLSDIAAIFFGDEARKLRPKTAGIVLRDGSVREGRVTFINLGSVDTDDDEIDRGDVLAVFFNVPEPPPDVVILRGGTARTGELTSCNAASCTISGSLVRLVDVVWIGLQREEVAPPATSGADEIHKQDGTVVPARLSALGDDSVSTTRGAFPRGEIAWIHLAPPPTTQPTHPGYGAPGDAPPPPGEPVRPPTDPGSSPPAPAPPPPPPPPPSSQGTSGGWPPRMPRFGDPPRRGALWTGTVIARYRHMNADVLTRWSIDARVRLRENTSPLPFGTGTALRSVGSFSWLVPEGTVLTHKVTCQGEVTCEGEGTITVSGEKDTQCSGFWWKNIAVDLTPQHGFDVPPTGLYSICLGAPDTAEFPVTYRARDGSSSTYPSRYASPVIGRHPLLATSHFMDPDSRHFPGGAGQMTGSFFKAATADYGSLRVSWSICREPNRCPPPGPLPPDPEDADDCPPPASQQALLERALDELRARYRALKDVTKEYRDIQAKAAQWEGDYTHVMRDCRLLAIAKFLAGYLLGNYAPTQSGRVLVNPARPGSPERIDTLPVLEPGKMLVNFVNFVEKVTEGDPSWLIPDTEFGPNGQQWVSVEDLWDGASVGWNYVEGIGATPAELREKMLTCGSPSIAAAHEGALKYLRYLEELRPLAEQMNLMQNDIRNLETNQLEGDLWPDYQRACLEYERCREGGDPSRCSRLPTAPQP